MTVPLVIQPEAEADLARAYAWYENRRPGLGAELLDEVDLVFSRIAENPTLLAPVYRDVRRQTLRRFPYVVLHIVRHGNA